MGDVGLSDRDRHAGTTHWETCYKVHPECAEALVEKLLDRLDAYEEAFQEILDLPDGTHATAAREIARRALEDGDAE